MHAGCSRLDHLLHQFKGVEHTAEAGFGIGDDGFEPVDTVIALGMLNLIGAPQAVVDAADGSRHRIGRVQRLIGVHLAGQIGIAGDLPAGKIDGVQARLDLLHGLVAGQRAQRIHIGFLLQVVPQFDRGQARDGVIDSKRAAQPDHILGRVGTGYARPARVALPVMAQGGGRVVEGGRFAHGGGSQRGSGDEMLSSWCHHSNCPERKLTTETSQC